MDREIESKYDVPLSLDLFIFFEQVYHLLPEMGFSIEEERVPELFEKT
ncbi:MAG: hypothetical protein GF334_07545 [Candidatus Altiarchaeales archaeon]|nr:hypothetical protein [Candidatus Altiarchaeales archaeon]